MKKQLTRIHLDFKSQTSYNLLPLCAQNSNKYLAIESGLSNSPQLDGAWPKVEGTNRNDSVVGSALNRSK